MDAIASSVSKGVFLFPNGFKKNKSKKKKHSKKLFETLFSKAAWYTTFETNWNIIENEIKELHHRTYSLLLNDIATYIKSFYDNSESIGFEGIIPSATLLTGVNQPDHVSQFMALCDKIRDEVTPHISMVNSQDAPTVKHLVENVVSQLCNGQEEIDISDEEEHETSQNNIKLKRSQCTMKTLKKWYQNKYNTTTPKKSKSNKLSKPLVVIIPDFEGFNCNVLQDFVMIASSYMPKLPLVFIFGVATSVSALHKSFPYHVSSKLLIKVFHSHSSPVYMNQVLEEVFLTHKSPFHLTGKAAELLTDVFLFYDFSVSGLIQSVKYCMMQHYYGDNIKSLCCARDDIREAIAALSPEDLECVRQLPSFRPFVEAQEDCRTQIALFEDDSFFRDVLHEEMNKLHDYMHSFYLCIRLLAVFVKDLPRNVLGKTVREIYTKCASEYIVDTETFKECMQLILFQSQIRLVENIKSALKVVNVAFKTSSSYKPLRLTPSKNNHNEISLDRDLGADFTKTVRANFVMFLRQIESANTDVTVKVNNVTYTDDGIENCHGNRYKLKQKLLRATKGERIQSEFETARAQFVRYLEGMFAAGLRPPRAQSFYEILFFGDVASVKKVLVGAPRGALHTALSDPAHYLQCACCRLPSAESVSGTLPDVCLAYKLHRECGKHINLYDWLQAFAAVLRPADDDDHRQHDPTVQSGRESYGDSAIGYVQVKREGDICTVKARITPEHNVHQKCYAVTLTCNEADETVLSVQCEDCAAHKGGCKHAIAFLAWLHRRSEDPPSTSVDCYWKKSTLSSVGTSLKFIKAKDICNAPKKPKLVSTQPTQESFLTVVKKHSKEVGDTENQLTKYFNEPSNEKLLSIHRLVSKIPKAPDSAKEFIEFCKHSMNLKACQDAALATIEQSDCPLWHVKVKVKVKSFIQSWPTLWLFLTSIKLHLLRQHP